MTVLTKSILHWRGWSDERIHRYQPKLRIMEWEMRGANYRELREEVAGLQTALFDRSDLYSECLWHGTQEPLLFRDALG
jgi:hypothetical protein